MTVNDKLMHDLHVLTKSFATRDGRPLEIPPQSVVSMQTVYIEYQEKRLLRAQMPFDGRYTNPAGVFQGGMLCAAFDNVFGPLSYLASEEATVTLEMDCRFIRPFLPADQGVVTTAEVVSKTKTLIVMTGEMLTLTGKRIAISNTTCMVVRATK